MSLAIPVQISTGLKNSGSIYIQIKNGNVYRLIKNVAPFKAQVMMNTIMAKKSVALKHWVRVR
jgi:hypothetical protein